MSEPLHLPRLFTERQAAAGLELSIDTLQRLRKKGEIIYRKIGGRIRYTQADLDAYLERAKRCENEKNDQTRSADTGSAVGPTARPGAEHGSTPSLDRRAAYLSAQIILSKPSSRSPHG